MPDASRLQELIQRHTWPLGEKKIVECPRRDMPVEKEFRELFIALSDLEREIVNVIESVLILVKDFADS